MAEKYTLNWHSFTDHLQLMIKDLYEEGKCSDVTLVCDDQNQFKAHKIVLSACSPVFKKIIDNNPSQHPLIYLRGIHSYEMESILQFMYLGEGKFYYERMGEFIKVAKDLEVKEISNWMEIPNEAIMDDEEIEKRFMTVAKNMEVKGLEIPDLVEVTEKTFVDNEKKEPDEEDEPKQTSEHKRLDLLSDAVNSTECPECGKVFSTKTNMGKHYRSKHEGIKYPCNQCDYQATRKDHLKTHIQSKH